MGTATSLDVSEASTEDGANVSLWQTNRSGAQVWKFEKSSGDYYYITNVASLRTGLWEVSMHTDPLMTYRSQLMDVSVILDTSTRTGADEYLTGPQFVARAKESTTVIPFPSGLAQNGEFILITAGG